MKRLVYCGLDLRRFRQKKIQRSGQDILDNVQALLRSSYADLDDGFQDEAVATLARVESELKRLCAQAQSLSS